MEFETKLENNSNLFEEAYKGNPEIVKNAVTENNGCLTLVDGNGRMLIHWASLGGHEEIVKFLLTSGSPVNPTDDIQMTPLILAASAGRVQVCHILISKGADVNARNEQGHSSLQYAASKGWKDIVKMLLINHADINIADCRGARPLHRAASKGMTPIVKILLDFGKQVDVDARDASGNTPLHLSCEENRVEEAMALVTHGAKLDALNKSGLTPLDLCTIPLMKTLQQMCQQPASKT